MAQPPTPLPFSHRSTGSGLALSTSLNKYRENAPAFYDDVVEELAERANSRGSGAGADPRTVTQTPMMQDPSELQL